MDTENLAPVPSKSSARRRAFLCRTRYEGDARNIHNSPPDYVASPYKPEGSFLLPWQSKLCEHGFPYLLIFEALKEVSHAGIDRVEDTQQDTLENDRRLFKEIIGFLHLAAQHFITQGGEIINIDVVLVNKKL